LFRLIYWYKILFSFCKSFDNRKYSLSVNESALNIVIPVVVVFGTTTLSSNRSYDALLDKYTSNGKPEWTIQLDDFAMD